MRDRLDADPVRDAVRAGIVYSLEQDVERRGGRTAGLLAVAGFAGVLAAAGATSLIAAHPFDHHPPWHATLTSIAWAGLLVVAFAIALLRVRTPAWPLAHAALVGLIGVGAAGVCGALCPDRHFLAWWSGTAAGRSIASLVGPEMGVACFGVVATFAIGAISAFLPPPPRTDETAHWIAAVSTLVALLLPAIVLQWFGEPAGILVGWIFGAIVGAGCGVAVGIGARRLLSFH